MAAKIDLSDDSGDDLGQPQYPTTDCGQSYCWPPFSSHPITASHRSTTRIPVGASNTSQPTSPSNEVVEIEVGAELYLE